MSKEKKESEGTAQVKMFLDKVCKSCVRFKADQGDPAYDNVGTAFYLQNAAFEALGKPKEIMVTVS